MALLPAGVSDSAFFFSALRESFKCAAAAAGLRERTFRIGDRPLRVSFAGPALEALLVPALRHLELAGSAHPGLRVYAFESAATGVAPPPPAWGSEAFGPRGEIAGFNNARFRTVYQPGSDVLLAMDCELGEAVYWTADVARVPYWESSFPLRTIIHWWCGSLPFQPTHAAAVGLPSGGALIAGPSGSGKSTAALACLGSRLLYAGDDYVLVSPDPPHVYSLYRTAKLESANLERFPLLAPGVSNPGRSGDEKALLYFDGPAVDFPICALLVPRFSGRHDTLLRPTSRAEAFLALAPTTLFQLPGSGRDAFSKMSSLVQRVPVYLLETGTDLAQIPAAILQLLQELS